MSPWSCWVTGSACKRCWPAPAQGSRRVCEELIAAGRVTVDGTVGRPGPAYRRGLGPGGGRRVLLPVAPDLVYYLLNKPRDVITTASDTHGRPDRLGARPARTAGLPGGPTRPGHRGAPDPDQRRVADAAPDPSIPRGGEGVRGRGRRRHAGGPAPCGRSGRASSSTTASPPRRWWACWRPGSCGWSSTRGGTGRCAGCATPSAIRSAAWCAPGSVRCATPGWRPGTGGC